MVFFFFFSSRRRHTRLTCDWSSDVCSSDLIRALEPYALDFVEQPVARWDREGLAEIARAVRVPVMADESCCSLHDALAIARLGGVSILALKLTKSAGILGTMAIARIAEAAGMG